MSGAGSIAIAALVILATVLLTLSIIGLVRIPNVYVKVHATSKSIALCPLLILVAVAPGGDPGLILRAILVGGLLLLTASVAAHAIVALQMHRDKAENAEEPPPAG